MEDSHGRYSISYGLRLIDAAPMRDGKPPLIWDPKRRRWSRRSILYGEFAESVPITEAEAVEFMASGTISESAQARLRMEMPDPWED